MPVFNCDFKWIAVRKRLYAMTREYFTQPTRFTFDDSIVLCGGVIDAGYRGEILILMTNLGDTAVELQAGDKIAQMIPVHVLTGPVEDAENLEDSARAAKGFGSSGK